MPRLELPSRDDWRRHVAPRNPGASLYFAAFLLLGPTALALGLANTQLQDPRFTVAAISSGSIALWSFQHAMRHDPCGGASLCVILGVLGALAGWAGIALGSSWLSWALLLGSLTVMLGSLVYLLWRHLGREQAPDLLADRESVYESGGVAVHWRAREHAVGAGRVAWIVVELQNGWRSRARVEIRLRRIGRGSALALPLRVVGTLESGEVGKLEIPVASRPAAAAGRVDVGIGIRARPHQRWRGRLRLRPKQPFPVGPAWPLNVLAIVAANVATYASASLELFVDAMPGPYPAEPEAADDPRWTRRWIPSDVPAVDADPVPSWVVMRNGR